MDVYQLLKQMGDTSRQEVGRRKTDMMYPETSPSRGRVNQQNMQQLDSIDALLSNPETQQQGMDMLRTMKSWRTR